MVQLVKHRTLDLSSGHDLTICEFEPLHRALTAQSLLGILSHPLSLSLSVSPLLSRVLSLKITK